VRFWLLFIFIGLHPTKFGSGALIGNHCFWIMDTLQKKEMQRHDGGDSKWRIANGNGN